MKILQVVHSFVPDTFAGTEIHCYQLSKELSKKHEVAVFYRINDPCQEEYEIRKKQYQGLTVFTLNNTFKKCGSFQETYSNDAIDKAFARLLDEIKPDIVHIQHLLFLSLGIVNEIKKRPIRVVFTCNDYWLFCHKGQMVRKDGRLCAKEEPADCLVCQEAQLSLNRVAAAGYRFLRKQAALRLLRACKAVYLNSLKVIPWQARRAKKGLINRKKQVRQVIAGIDRFIAPSLFMQSKALENGIPAEKILLCRHGLEKGRFARAKTANQGIIRFCFIGTLLPEKGIDLLVKAFKQLKNKNAALHIYGKNSGYAGYEDFFTRLKEAASDDKRIQFMGIIKNEMVYEAYSCNDILIFPSIWNENSPLVILEALASGTPVIASRIGGIPEFIQHGINGLLFEPGNAEELQQALSKFFDDPILLPRLQEGIGKVKGIEEYALEIENVYRKSCETRK